MIRRLLPIALRRRRAAGPGPAAPLLAEDWSRAWRGAVAAVFLQPYGVREDAPFALDAAAVADVVARNPGAGLAADDFVTVRAGAPFPVVGVTMLGPLAAEPLVGAARQFVQMEVGSPLYPPRRTSSSCLAAPPRGAGA